MSDTIRGIFIDPHAETVSEIKLPQRPDLLKALYKQMDCRLVEAVHTKDGTHDLIVDEEGTFIEDNPEFVLFSVPFQVFCGKAVLLGVKGSQWVSCTLSVEKVRSDVKFISKKTSRALSRFVERHQGDTQ